MLFILIILCMIASSPAHPFVWTVTAGAYTTVSVFTGDGIAKQPGFGQKTVHMGAWARCFGDSWDPWMQGMSGFK